jgi:chromosome segregation ATPase
MLLREKWQLEQAQREAADIDSTRDALREVATCIRTLTHAAALSDGYLGTEKQNQLRNDLENIAAKARDLHGQFAYQRKQVQSLASQRKKVEEVQGALDANWSAYAKQVLAPRFELLPLARAFEAANSELSTVEASLRKSSEVAPTSASQLTNFKANIEKLDELLSSLQSSGPAVKEFLLSVLQGKATLADLSPDVLEWCNSKNLSASFRIGLGQTGFRG